MNIWYKIPNKHFDYIKVESFDENSIEIIEVICSSSWYILKMFVIYFCDIFRGNRIKNVVRFCEFKSTTTTMVGVWVI